MKKADHARLRVREWPRLATRDGVEVEPRRYAQSTSGRICSQRTTPPLSRSMLITTDSRIRSSVDNALRRYPSDVPHLSAKDSWSGFDNEFRYDRRSSIRKELPFSNSMSIPSGHLPCGNRQYTHEVDLQAVRRQRLMELIEEVGGQKKLAALLDSVREKPLSATYISNMKRTGKGKKTITGDMARDLEIACNKPSGWMSSLELPASQVREPTIDWPLSVPLSDFESLSPQVRRGIDEAFTRMVAGAKAQELTARQKKKFG